MAVARSASNAAVSAFSRNHAFKLQNIRLDTIAAIRAFSASGCDAAFDRQRIQSMDAVATFTCGILPSDKHIVCANERERHGNIRRIES